MDKNVVHALILLFVLLNYDYIELNDKGSGGLQSCCIAFLATGAPPPLLPDGA
jgi:hypothetical protein